MGMKICNLVQFTKSNLQKAQFYPGNFYGRQGPTKVGRGRQGQGGAGRGRQGRQGPAEAGRGRQRQAEATSNPCWPLPATGDPASHCDPCRPLPNSASHCRPLPAIEVSWIIYFYYTFVGSLLGHIICMAQDNFNTMPSDVNDTLNHSIHSSS